MLDSSFCRNVALCSRTELLGNTGETDTNMRDFTTIPWWPLSKGGESVHLPVTGNTYTSVPKPGSKPEACVPGRDVLRLWSILVLGNHCGLTILGSQNRILRSSEQEDIGKLEARQWVSAMLSAWLRHLLTVISTWWPCLIHQRGRMEEGADVHDWPSYWDIFLNVIWCNKCGHKLMNKFALGFVCWKELSLVLFWT